MGSLPPSEAGDDGWVAPPRIRRQVASGQPQLTRRDRQQVYLVQDIAREMEHSNPGSIHEIKLMFAGRRLHASIVFDRDRGVKARDGAAQQDSHADSAPAPQGSQGSGGRCAGQQPDHRPAPRASEYKGPPRPIHSARMGATQPQPRPDRVGIPAGRNRPTAMADLTKADVTTIERTVKAAITPIVREMGGDEKNGANYLSPPFKIQLGGYKTGPIRVPLGSRAHNHYCRSPDRCAETIGKVVLEKYLDKRTTSRDVEGVMTAFFRPHRGDSMETSK